MHEHLIYHTSQCKQPSRWFSLMSLLFGAIADDLTGGVELAAMLTAGGMRTLLVTDPALVPSDIDAVVIAQRSRVAQVEAARTMTERAAHALQRAGARRLFLKYCATFDSTPQGNIGPCSDVLCAAVGSDLTLFCPAFPEVDRTVYRGHLFVGSQLVSRSPKRDDPLTPMTEPDLVAVLQPQTRAQIGLLPWQVIAQGHAAITAHLAALRDRNVRYVIADTVHEDDLRLLAEVTADWPVMTGGSSIAAHYPAIWRRQGRLGAAAGPPRCAQDGPAAVIAGSCADRTRAQIAEFARHHPVWRIAPLSAKPEQLVAAALEWAAARLAAGPICITTSDDPAVVAAAQRQLGAIPAALLSERILGRIAAGLVACGVRRMLVAGGETSGAVIDALGIGTLRVAPYEAAGLGLCRAELPVPLALCLKSGKLGPVDMFATMLARMSGRGGSGCA
jgi:3-dehydrotetronate 4-kinase